MPSEYDALLEQPPTQTRSEYDALLEQPSKGGVGQALENAGAAALNVAKGFVKGFLPKFDTKSLAEIAFAPAAVASQTMQMAEGAIDAVKQVGEAEKTPAFSRERFEAGFNVAGQLAMIAGLKGGVEAAYRPTPLMDVFKGKVSEAPVTDIAKEVTDNAVKERNIQESVQPKRTGDGEVGTSRETSGGSSIQPEAQVPAQTPQVAPVPQPEQPRILSTAVQREGQIFQGQNPTDMHVDIGEQHGLGVPAEPERGFIVQEPSGETRLLGREEGGKIADQTGQRPAQFAGQPLRSEHLQPKQQTVDPISSAAYKLPNGKIYTGRIHIEALRAAEDDLGHPLNPSELQSGFVTKSGRFMNNAEAMKYATETKQIDKSEYDKQGEGVEGYISPSNLEAGRFNQVKRIPSEIQTTEKSTTIPSEERTVNQGEISIKEVQTKPELVQSEPSPVSQVAESTNIPEGQKIGVSNETQVLGKASEQIGKSSQIQSPVGKATEIVLEPPGSVLAKLSFGDEKKVGEISSFTSRTTKRGKKYDFSLSEYDLPDGRKRFTLSAGGELVDAAALVKLTPAGPEIQMLHAGKTGFEGLGGTLAKEITKRYGKPVVAEGSPLSPATSRYATSGQPAGVSTTAEPPLQKGMTRLYRGGVTGKEGQWFSTDPDTALFHYQNASMEGKSNVSFVDVPTSELEKYNAAEHPSVVSGKEMAEANDYILPKDISSSAKQLGIIEDEGPLRIQGATSGQQREVSTTAELKPKPEGGVSEKEVQVQGQGGQEVLGGGGVQPPAAPPETPQELGRALSEEPRLAGPSNRVLQERAARGEIPQVPGPSTGILKEDLIRKANERYSPERAQQAGKRAMRGVTSLDDEADVVLHEEKLTKAAADAERALKANPMDLGLQKAYQAARNNMTDWQHGPVAAIKAGFNRRGINLQGATDVDTGTLVGLQKHAWDTGHGDFTPEQIPIMTEAADRVDKAVKAEKASILTANDKVQKILKPSRYLDLNTLRESLNDTLKTFTC